MNIDFTDGDSIQKLRDQEDLKLQRDQSNEEPEVFDDWKERQSYEYVAGYCEMLSDLYTHADTHGEEWAISNAQDEMVDWIDVYRESSRHRDGTIAKIHACKDFVNGEDPFYKEC